MRAEKCPFCSIGQDRVVVAGSHAIAIADKFPLAKGHTLVIPKKHVRSIFELDANEAADLWGLLANVRQLLVNKFRPDGLTVGINDGNAAGQTVSHGHIHMIPRYKGDVEEPRGGVRWIIPSKAKYWQ